MRVLVAPQEFKGTLSAAQAAEAIAQGVRGAQPGWEVELAPIADGGPGTVDALVSTTQYRPIEAQVTDALGRRVTAYFAMRGDGEAVVEMAQACGLSLLAASERDPLRATSYGAGELIRAALDAGAKQIDVGAGGSATTDGGAGALLALGMRLLDAGGGDLPPGGAALRGLAAVDATTLDMRLANAKLRVWVDVQNPLLGPDGAAGVYAPQKGARGEEVAVLEAGLARLAAVLRDAGLGDVAALPGAGAAGGLAFGLSAVFGAQLVPGFEQVARALRLEERVRACDVVLTGEGRLDVQTGYGKGPAALAQLARARGRPIICFAGQVNDEGAARAFDHVEVAGGGLQVPSAAQARTDLQRAAARWASDWPTQRA